PVLMLEGDVLSAARRYAEAANAYDQSARLRPGATIALRAYTARRLAQFEDPAKPLREWLARDPDEDRVRLALAESYQATDPAQAIEEYERVLAHEPDDPRLLNNLAWLYRVTGNEKALETARKAYRLAPDLHDIADTYGWILLQKGRVAEALPVLKA